MSEEGREERRGEARSGGEREKRRRWRDETRMGEEGKKREGNVWILQISYLFNRCAVL